MNPLLDPIRRALEAKRMKEAVPRNFLLAILYILDQLAQRDSAITEDIDDIYSYDFTLPGARGDNRRLLEKYGFPTKLGMSHEGVTMRGAPALRLFREIRGGGVIMDKPQPERQGLIAEAIELVRAEMIKTVSQSAVALSSEKFDDSGIFVSALLEAVENRSSGRVEQALVGAKLQLAYPDIVVPDNPAFAGDKQTSREADFEIGTNLRVIVSVSPKDQHFESAATLSQRGRQVMFVVSEKAFKSTRNRVRKMTASRTRVITVEDYVVNNMIEIAERMQVDSREMCMLLVTEYNRRILADNDRSLQVVVPE